MSTSETHSKDKHSNRYIISTLIDQYLKKYLDKLILSLILMVVIASTTAFNVWLIKPALDGIFISKNYQLLMIIPMLVIITSIIKGIAAFYQNFLIKFVGQSIVNDMQLKLYRHLIYADMNFLEKNSSGKLISHFTNDITNLRNSVANIVTNLVRELLTVIFLIAVMLYNDTTLSMLTLVVFPLAILPILRMGKRIKKISGKTQHELGSYTSQLDEVFKNIRVVKSFTSEKHEVSVSEKKLSQILEYYRKSIRTDSLTSPIMELLGGVAIALVIWYGGTQVLNSSTSAGSFFSFIAALMSIYKPIKSLADINITIQSGLASAKRVLSILDQDFHNDHCPSRKKEIKVLRGKIEFNQITYGHTKNSSTVENLSFLIKPQTCVALVGESGSGKSTIIDLLLSFYNPESGKILIDGQDISKVNVRSLRKNISLVNQDAMLFDLSIKDNIRYGNFKASDKEIIAAAKEADAHKFIESLPMGYDTRTGQAGVSLSGGQRQRICIARAVLKKSPILIFDEATSSLDQISEYKIQDTIEKLKQKHTIIVVAHRLSTIQKADVIFVLKKGNICEQGTHSELIARNGEYYKLYNRQSKLKKGSKL
ncbi:MAG: ABC transporter transmembrane domain-containing protein [Rickettsiales bacterium]